MADNQQPDQQSYDPNADRDSRFRSLFGRDMTEAELKLSDLRESGYRGWVDQDGRAVSDEQHQADLKQRWADNEAAGLRYDSRQGWVRKDAKAGR